MGMMRGYQQNDSLSADGYCAIISAKSRKILLLEIRDGSSGACSRARWVSALLLEWLQHAVQPPGSKTCLLRWLEFLEGPPRDKIYTAVH